MNYYKKIFNYVNNLLTGQNKKKVVENAVIVIIIGVIIIIAGGAFFGKSDNKESASASQTKAVETASNSNNQEDASIIDRKIETVLSQISGAGKVNVMVTYVSGKEIVPAVDSKKSDNETYEKDNQGGTRNISQNNDENTVVYEESQSGVKKPVVIKEIQPTVKGVVVVADGASDPVVKENLARAVQVLVDIPIYKIQVFERAKFSK